MSSCPDPMLGYGGYTVPNVSVLVVAPVLEPFTVDEAKERAAWPASDTTRDAMMADFIKAARERVERDTGHALLTQTRDVYLSHYVTPFDFPGSSRPLQSVEALVAPDSDPVDPDPPLTLPDVVVADYPWIYRVVVGWKTVEEIPPSLRFAVGLLTAHYATAGRDAVISGTGMVAEMPLGYEDAISDWKRVSV